MRKKIVLVIVGTIAFVGYIYEYQQLVNKGSYLADEHCIKVNPLIIDRKNKYTDQYNVLISSPSSELYVESLDKYRISANNYIKGEQEWLPKQRKYLDSKWFNWLMPSYIKEASQYQYQMYEAQYLSSVYLMQLFEEKDQTKQAEISNKVMDETAKSNKAGDNYQELWEREKGRSSWVYYFVKVPQGKCPKENFDFPNVFNPFVTPVPIGSGETKG